MNVLQVVEGENWWEIHHKGQKVSSHDSHAEAFSLASEVVGQVGGYVEIVVDGEIIDKKRIDEAPGAVKPSAVGDGG